MALEPLDVIRPAVTVRIGAGELVPQSKLSAWPTKGKRLSRSQRLLAIGATAGVLIFDAL